MLHILKAPEYRGRPEPLINQAIIKTAIDRGIDFLTYDITRPNSEVETVGSCYNNDKTVRGQIIQFQNFIFNFEEGDDVLCLEGFNPALLFLPLMAKKTGKVGVLYHSSTAISADAYSNNYPVSEMEKGISNLSDVIFCATQYISDKIKNCEPSAKTLVTGLPFDTLNEVFVLARKKEKKDVVIFNHRWANDKRPEMFLELAKRFPKYQFIVLTPYENVISQVIKDRKSNNVIGKLCRTRIDYFKELSEAKYIFSAAELETFGYSVLEGVACGAIPILTNTACYNELYPLQYLGDTVNDLARIMNEIKVFDSFILKNLEKYRYSSERILDFFNK
jgi:glycosyltransferase involved in cell wall biosynthesis